jgi:hypothetical protein
VRRQVGIVQALQRPLADKSGPGSPGVAWLPEVPLGHLLKQIGGPRSDGCRGTDRQVEQRADHAFPEAPGLDQ